MEIYINFNMLSLFCGHSLVFVYKCIALEGGNSFPGPLTVVKTFIQKLYTKAPDGATLPVHLISSLKVALWDIFLGFCLGFQWEL